MTAVEPIDDITKHMESPEIKDKLLVGQCIAIYINRSTSCIACNKIQPVNKNYTCFNDAIQSFFTINCPTPMSELKEDEMKKLFLTTGQMRMIASKNTKIISQFLEIVA